MHAMHDDFGMTPDRYWSLLASFSRECEAKGFTHDGMEKYKEHFYNWTRRHVEINGKDENKNKGKGYGNNDYKPGLAGHGESRRDAELRRGMDNMLAKYGLTSEDVGY